MSNERHDAEKPDEGVAMVVRCAWCGRVKEGESWLEVDEVLAMRLVRPAPDESTHGICPDCFERHGRGWSG